LLIGIVFGVIYFHIAGPPVTVSPKLWGIIYSYIPPIFYLLVLSKNKETIHKSKLSSLKAFAGMIAHEMRTPLGSINAYARSLKKLLPYIIPETTEKKKEHEIALSIPDQLIDVSQHGFTIIENTLVNIKGTTEDAHLQVCRMSQIIEEALKEYPFTENETDLLEFKLKDDFNFLGNNLWMKHTLFNLIKNGLYSIKAAGKGNITIETCSSSKYNTLIFRDTGLGLDKARSSKIFEPFVTTKRHGSGLGLHFCKNAIDAMHGTIQSDGKLSEFAEFVITFPKIPKDTLK